MGRAPGARNGAAAKYFSLKRAGLSLNSVKALLAFRLRADIDRAEVGVKRR
jgi:hypothetical protein